MREVYNKDSFFRINKPFIAAIAFLVLFATAISYATPPGSPYNPGETLDPLCAPGETNCSVQQTVGSGSATWGMITGTLAGQTDLAAALNSKEAAFSSGTSSQFLRGDKTFVTIDTTIVSEGSRLYFTDARAIAAVTGQNVSILNNDAGYLNDVTGVPSARAVDAEGNGIVGGGSLAADRTIALDFTYLDGRYAASGSGVTTFNGRSGAVSPTSGDYTTSQIAEGSNLYYTQGRFNTALAGKTTDDLTEGSRQYYTQGRFNTAFSAKTTDDLVEGLNKYYTQARFDTALAAKNTDNIAEGSRLYFTNARAITALTGQNISLLTNDAGYLTALSTVPWANITSRPTTLAGYGITDAVPSSRTVTATGNGITGGGSLSGNRTFSLDFTYLDTRYASSGSNVSSFNGRSGAIVPTSGDYTTSLVTEGSNLYYSQSRFDSALAAKTTDSVAEGTTNKYFTNSAAVTALTGQNVSIFTNDVNYLTDVTGVSSARAITASGNGITGGGSLAADRTISLDFTYLDARYAPSSAGVASFNGRSGVVTPTSGDYTTSTVPEGTNLYYTPSRFNTAFGSKTTDDLTEGTNLYYSQSRFNAAFGAKTTDDLTEGATKKYFSNAQAIAALTGQNVSIFTNDIGYLTSASTIPWSSISSKPTTLGGYGITDAVIAARTITATGNGITGGGSLAADRTISLDFTYLDARYAAFGSGVTSFNGRTGSVSPTSGDYTTSTVPEGTNQYYTQSRFNTAFAAKSTTDLAEGTRLYFTNARAITALTGQNVSIFNNDAGYLTSASNIPWANISSKPTTVAGYGITDAYTKTESDGSYFPAVGGTLTGTAGNGFVGLPPQSSAPSTPASGVRLYARSTGALAWVGTNGFSRTIAGQSLTADRTYTLPDADVVLVGDSNDQTISGVKTFSSGLVSPTVAGSATNGGTLILTSTSAVTKGNILFGNSAYDEVNNRLGISTASPSAKIDITTNGLGATQNAASGLALVNTSAALVSAQQISPALRWTGYGWATTGSSSQAVSFQSYVLPVQGGSPSGTWQLQSSINGGAYSTVFTVTSNGTTTSTGNFGAVTGTFSASLSANGVISSSNGSVNSNFITGSGTNAGVSTNNQLLFAGASTIYFRTSLYGSNSTSITVGASYTNLLVASAPITTFSSGTHALLANVVVNPIGTITQGSSTVTNTATVYIAGAASASVTGSNYSLWVASGLSYFGDTSVTTGTTVARFQNAGGTCNIVPSTSGGITCSSDMTLKKNIVALGENSAWSYNANIATENQSTLAKILALTPVQYNWNVENNNDPKHAGFIAQEVRQLFPDLVSEDPKTHLLSLNYAGLVPYTVQAIKEMNMQVTDLSKLDKPNTLRESLVTWLGDSANGIMSIFSKKITTDQLCVRDSGGETCYTRSQLNSALQGQNNGPQTTTVIGPEPTPEPATQTPAVTAPEITTEEPAPEVPEEEEPAAVEPAPTEEEAN